MPIDEGSQGMPRQDVRMPPPGMPPQMTPPGMVNQIPLGTGTAPGAAPMREASEPQMPPTPPTQQGGGAGGDMKKRLLQKLMSDILDKPGRSVNEIINGVKAAIGAYKNYSKEWDTLNGVAPEEGKQAGIDSAQPPQPPMMG